MWPVLLCPTGYVNAFWLAYAKHQMFASVTSAMLGKFIFGDSVEIYTFTFAAMWEAITGNRNMNVEQQN